jgi:hypothetical protein
LTLYIKRETSDHGASDEHEKNKFHQAAAFFSFEKNISNQYGVNSKNLLGAIDSRQIEISS